MSTSAPQFDSGAAGAQEPIRVRPAALRRYGNRTESAVSLKMDSGRKSAVLWFALLLLLGCGAAVWMRAAPVYVSGDLVRAKTIHTSNGATPVLLLLRPEQLSRLQVGKRVVLVAARERVNGKVLAIEPAVSIGALRDKLGLLFEAASPVAEPTAIAVIQLESSIDAFDLHKTRVEIGERRLMAMLPLVGRLFEV